MRVGIVTPRYPPNVAGGGETSVKLLAEQLSVHPRTDHVTVFSFDGEGTERRDGVEVRRLRQVAPTVTEWQNLRASYHLAGRLGGYDVVHGYNMELNPTVGVIGAREGAATVATLNSYHFLPKSVSNAEPSPVERLYELVGHPTTGRLMFHAMRRMDSFVAISSAVRDIYASHGLRGADIEVIPNMLDPSFSVPERATGPGVSVLYVGQLSERKGVTHLVEAMGELPAEFTLRVVGDGPERRSAERLAKSLELTDRVMFTGHVNYDEVAREYAAADVFVHPGVWPEPFGRTVLEAMQAGLPVVCTDIGGPSDIVQEPEFRCQPGDPEALAASLRAAVRHENIGAKNRRYVEETYAPETITDRIVGLYERVLECDPTETVN